MSYWARGKRNWIILKDFIPVREASAVWNIKTSPCILWVSLMST